MRQSRSTEPRYYKAESARQAQTLAHSLEPRIAAQVPKRGPHDFLEQGGCGERRTLVRRPVKPGEGPVEVAQSGVHDGNIRGQVAAALLSRERLCQHRKGFRRL